MRLTTLCYIAHNGCYLMLHRIKKDQDENAGKWIGIGGHMEDGESPEECVRWEAREETGLTLTHLRLRGILTFILPAWGNELTFLFTAQAETVSNLAKCAEGVLEWVPVNHLLQLPLWEGDRIFLPLLETCDACFSLKLVYDKDGNLVRYSLEE